MLPLIFPLNYEIILLQGGAIPKKNGLIISKLYLTCGGLAKSIPENRVIILFYDGLKIEINVHGLSFPIFIV